MSFLFVLAGLLNLPFGYAQCSEGEVPPAEGYSVTAYQSQIDYRVDLAESTINTALDNISLQAGNYVVLNDKDFYANKYATTGYAGKCKWGYIDAHNDSYGSEIDNITYVILTPGDYRDYLAFNPRLDPDTYTYGRKYLLHYPGKDSDPMSVIQAYFDGTPKAAVDQEEDERAIIENFILDNNEWSWVVRGITVRGNRSWRHDDENNIWGTGSSTSRITGDNNIIESCLFENQVKSNYINITNGDNNIVHNCVIRDQQESMITYLAGNDIVGIKFGAIKDSFAINNTILNNKIYNVTDAIHLVYQTGSHNGDADDQIGELPGTFIYGNEMFNERIYIDDCGEEKMNGEGAIDIKQGFGGYGHGEYANICDKVIITNNEFYGWRRGGTDGLGRVIEEGEEDDLDCATDPGGKGGGTGEAITCHINAKNIVIYDNLVYDCNIGFMAGGAGYDEYGNLISVSHIEILDNTICNLYPWSSDESDLNYDEWSKYIPYLHDKEVGLGIKMSAFFSKVAGNKVSNVVEGILITDKDDVYTNIEVSDNYFENAIEQTLLKCRDYSNVTNNTFVDTQFIVTNAANTETGCTANMETCEQVEDRLINNNCFIDSPICE